MPPPELLRDADDAAKRTELAAWVLFALVTPTDRALAGWCPAGEAYFEAEALTRTAATGDAA